MTADPVPTGDSRGTDADLAEQLLDSGVRDPEVVIRAEHAAYARGYAEGVADAEARFSERHSLPEHCGLLAAARRQGFADGAAAVARGYAAVRGAGRQ
jgi:hypothetical protein